MRLLPLCLALACAPAKPADPSAPADDTADPANEVPPCEPDELPTSPPDCEPGETCWVPISCGTFLMGADPSDPEARPDEYPRNEVSVPAFDILQTEVTVTQYLACVDAGACPMWPAEVDATGFCFREPADLPVNCIDWFMAQDYCGWIGGRLPSEAEWEYAARGAGQEIRYPWGNDAPTCDHVILSDDTFLDCGVMQAQPVCTPPLGASAHGLCDMAGNVFEWVQDWHHDGYVGAPTDGSAREDPPGIFRGMRGGGVRSAEGARTTGRTYHEPEFYYGGLGIRCARDRAADAEARRGTP